ncbi:NAD-dependent epimerase/dehydratase family protein, partial [bacterium]|nr:NAD-dependent epimerase/dehydratase family protein [bacterium]
MKTIIVTGGYGFIGGNFIRLLAKERPDWKIVNVDKCTYAANPKYIADLDIDNYDIDISNTEAVIRGYSPDFIVNFAAETHVDNSIKDPGVFVKTNVLGTQHLLDLSIKYNVKKFVQVSTDEVYGHLAPCDPPFDEDTPIDPRSPYSASKAGADHLVQAYHNTYGLNTCITRCSNNYGPNQNREKLIPNMINKALKDEPLPV